MDESVAFSLPSRSRSLSQIAVRFSCWGVMAASVAAYTYVSMDVFHQPFHVGVRHLRYFDLRIYRGAGWRVAHHRRLYAKLIIRHLGFTYPPIAALLFVPLILLPFTVDKHIVLAINVVVLLLTLRWTIALALAAYPRLTQALARPADAWATAALAAGAALWLEPITVTLGYGQIDLLVTALVLFDFSRPNPARTKGLTIGLAAGLKLTPLVFIPYLLLSGRRRAAMVAIATFAATIAAGFALDGRDSGRYWGGLFVQSNRVGPTTDLGNQSLRSALARLAGTHHPGAITMLAVGAVALIGLGLAVRASRRGNEPAGFGLCAIVALLASPVTWTHHWALAVPGILLIALFAYERRSRALSLAAAALLAAGYAYLPEREFGRTRTPIGGLRTLTSDWYTLIGLLVLAAALTYALAPALLKFRK
jgi:alpha-1,2-mannosyltransferase